jgi:mono/diheme cytochrome c family protein
MVERILRPWAWFFCAGAWVVAAQGQEKAAQVEVKEGGSSATSPAEPERPAGDEEKAKLATAARGVLKQYCLRCHKGEGSEGGDFDVLKVADLVEKGDRDEPLVIKGDPDASFLFQRILSDEMPPKSAPLRPDGEARRIILDWIKQGAADFPKEQEAKREPVALKEVLTLVRDHLRGIPEEQRERIRFFTLHQVANDPGASEADLRLRRAALSKLINSLSDKRRIVVPKAIDPGQTVFAIDLGDYGWDRDTWIALEQAYPYGLAYANRSDQALGRLDREIEEESGTTLPILRADWFIATASRPPLYHQILKLPEVAKDLEQRLGVDIAANFKEPDDSRNERIARGGFARSGVSGQNRLVERHEMPFGAYWKSYDFKAGNARAKLTRFPLGPKNLFPAGEHPFERQAFVHDGGEIIYNLPNGLQAYMLIDGEDNRIGEGPIEVVSDALKTSGTPAIVTGVSCMACHKHGMIPFKDEVRAGSALFAESERQVQRLYPEAKVMDGLLEHDERAFMAALEKAVGPFLLAGNDSGKDLKVFPDPVGEVARGYRLGYLDLGCVARELDLADPAELLGSVGERRLKELGLEILTKKGVIGRPEWEAVDRVSLMQELARDLRYTPKTVK